MGGHRRPLATAPLPAGGPLCAFAPPALLNLPPLLRPHAPTGNLDPATALCYMGLRNRINKTGTTVLVATHDRDMVDSMRKRVIALENVKIIRDQSRGVYGYGD